MRPTALLYDADCGFCRWSTALILDWDRRRRLRPVALQDPEADRLLGGMPPQEKMESFHLVTPQGDIRSGGAALAPLLRMLPGGAPLAALLERAPATADRGYRWVARNRGPFGRTVGRIGRDRARRVIAERASGGGSVV